MECGAVIDACQALSVIESSFADDANEQLGSIVRMLSKMCLQ
jgi:hypothetical protein